MITEVIDHIWQSTLFSVAVWCLALGFRKNHAEIRYWLWFSASCKFFIPFSFLMNVGSHVGSVQVTKTVVAPAVSFTIDQISRPFPHAIQLTAPATGAPTDWLPLGIGTVWICGFGLTVLTRFREWLRIQELVRLSSPSERPAPLPIRTSYGLLEPSVVGFWRPILLLPAGITEYLTPWQLEAVLAHELCHARRRDNLAAAMQMMAEAIFWFYPLVWWIGARLVEERERGCDEEVLRLGSEPLVYANAILKTCQFCVESRLACVSAITGSDLKKRIGAIMSGQIGRELRFGQKLLLAAAGMVAIGGPLLSGVLNPSLAQAGLQGPRQPARPLTFEVASIKPNRSPDNRRRSKKLQFTPGGRFIAVNLPLAAIIAVAYDVWDLHRFSEGPAWINSEKYDIEAIAEKDAIPAGSSANIRDEKMRLMLQTLLADRFKLVIRREMKERPVYALIVAKNGPKLQKASTDEDSCALDSDNESTACHLIDGGEGRGLHGAAVDMADFAQSVSEWTDRPVIDRTGLKGLFNIQTEGWVSLRQAAPLPDNETNTKEPALADSSRPTLFMILQRLGLKLESQHAPVESFVIEHVERPTAN